MGTARTPAACAPPCAPEVRRGTGCSPSSARRPRSATTWPGTQTTGSRLGEDAPDDPDAARAALLAAVGADPEADQPVAGLAGTPALDALRVAYRRRLLAIAGRDLDTPDPPAAAPGISRDLADLAAAALEAALAIARAESPAGCAAVPDRRDRDGQVRRPRAQLRQRRRRDLRRRTRRRRRSTSRPPSPPAAASPPPWPGPARRRRRRGRCGRSTPPCAPRASAVRSFAPWPATSRTTSRWATTWEFQALLKARPVAGDVRLGPGLPRRDPADGLAGRRARALRRGRAGDAPPRRGARAGPGRGAPAQARARAACATSSSACSCCSSCTAGRIRRLRTGNTLEALEALAAYGYVGRGRRRRARPRVPVAAHPRAPHPAAPAAAHARGARAIPRTCAGSAGRWASAASPPPS